jgi:hypothetical protein
MATQVEKFAPNRPTRMLFSNLSQLKFNSPLVEQEPLFIAALIEFCRRKGITSLFIDVKNPRQKAIGDIFDVILRTDSEPNQPELVKFWVGHSGPGNADRTPKWVERLRDPGANRGYLVLKKSSEESISVAEVCQTLSSKQCA